MESTQYEKALLNPASIFSRPEEVAERDDLTTKEKIDILRRWEYDAAELAVAEEEGMGDDGASPLLRQILLTLEGLGSMADPESTPPTKHGRG